MSRGWAVPNELVTQIIRDVEPRDVVNFALVCKRFLEASAGRLRLHHRYRRRYSVLDTNNGYTRVLLDGDAYLVRHLPRDENLQMLIEPLRQAILQPSKAHYVATLAIGDHGTKFFTEGTQGYASIFHNSCYYEYNQERTRERLEEVQNLFKDRILRMKLINGERVIADLEAYQTGTLVGLLLCHTPNISNLLLQHGDATFASAFMRVLSDVQKSPGLCTLRNIQTITFQRGNDFHSRVETPYYLIDGCLRFPTLRALHAGRIGWTDDDWDGKTSNNEPVTAGSSKVFFVELVNNTIRGDMIERLDAFLAAFGEIDQFIWILNPSGDAHSSDDESELSDCRVDHLVNKLAEIASSSLDNLKIPINAVKVRAPTHLNRFHKLAELWITFAMLPPQEDVNSSNAATIFPQSLKKLTISDSWVALLEDKVDSLIHLMGYRNLHFPNLEKLKLFLDDSGDDHGKEETYMGVCDNVDKVKDMCRKQGLGLSVKYAAQRKAKGHLQRGWRSGRPEKGWNGF